MNAVVLDLQFIPGIANIDVLYNVQSQASHCGICGEQNCTNAGFLVLGFSHISVIPPEGHDHSFICHRRYKVSSI